MFIVMPKKRRMPAHIKKLNKARQDAKLADAKAAAAKQATQLTAAPPDPPPAASSEAKPSSPSSLPHSIEENLVVPTPQIGSGSTDTASSAPGAAAQPKALLGCPNKRGRQKGDPRNRGQGTAAATEARVAQEARDFVLNAPVPPKEPKFLPDSSGMYPRPDAHGAWPSTAEPRSNTLKNQAAETLKQAEQAFEDQKTLAEATTGVWEEMEQALSTQHAARQLGNCACACACQGPPLKTEPFQSHLAKATRQLSSQF